MYRVYTGRYGIYKENFCPDYEEEKTMEDALKRAKSFVNVAKRFYKDIDGYDVPWHVAIEYIPDSQDGE